MECLYCGPYEGSQYDHRASTEHLEKASKRDLLSELHSDMVERRGSAPVVEDELSDDEDEE